MTKIKIKRGAKTELDPNNAQITMLRKSAGVARFSYNLALQMRKDFYEQNGYGLSDNDTRRTIDALKGEMWPWMYEVSKCCVQQGAKNVEIAYQRFFQGIAEYPHFKSSKNGRGSFFVEGSVYIYEDRVTIPKIGDVRLKEHGYIPLGKPTGATISEHAGRWFVSIHYEVERKLPKRKYKPEGADRGCRHMVTYSDDTHVPNPKPLYRYESKMKRFQRELARRQKGSKNREKTRQKISKLHFRIHNIRLDAIHKATTQLARTKSVVVLEDLRIKNMVKNHNRAKSISDASMGEFRRQLTYKLPTAGGALLIVDTFYPSTQLCSSCGSRNTVNPNDTTYICTTCGNIANRDGNAARNLRKVADSWKDTINACGDSVRPGVFYGRLDSAKQEPSFIWEVKK